MNNVIYIMDRSVIEEHIVKCGDIPQFTKTTKKIIDKINPDNYISMMVGFGIIKHMYHNNLLPNSYYRYEDFVIEYFMKKSKMNISDLVNWTVSQILNIPNITLEHAETIATNIRDPLNNTIDPFRLYVEIEEKLYNLNNKNNLPQNNSSQLINAIDFFLEKHKLDTGHDIYNMTNDIMDKQIDLVPGSA